MEIDSCRELKTSLVEKVVRPLADPARRAELAVAARRRSKLEALPRTFALGVSRAKRGKRQFNLAVRVQNLALLDSPEIKAILKRAKGEVDVQLVGRITKRASWVVNRQRPVLMGASAGHENISAGTVGFFATRRADGTLVLVSNNHVLADENRGAVGDRILQPGWVDGGRLADAIGTLWRFERLRPGATVNYVDAAYAKLKSSVTVSTTRLRGFKKLKGLRTTPVDVGLQVRKIGRTTGLSKGRVTAFEIDHVVVGYETGNVRFDDQIEVEGIGQAPFSRSGDSGALVVDSSARAIGMLFAGSELGGTNNLGLTYVNPIQMVLDALEIDFVP